MKINNGRLEGVRYIRAACQGGRMHPTAIILHDTAGRITPKFSSVNWFQQKRSRASAHFVIERDGTITQMVDCDRKAWHAGRSSLNGRKHCNSFTIGIEIVNPGKMNRVGPAVNGKVGPWFNKTYDIDEWGIKRVRTSEHGDGYWMPYTDAQIEAVTEICQALKEAYPSIDEITTHYTISPRRKVDTNPLFPLEDVRNAVFRGATKNPASDTLEIGVRSDDVRLAQARLKDLGYQVVGDDGIFGPDTRNAVLAFEAENNLDTDGNLDKDEQALLFSDRAKEKIIGSREEDTARDIAAKGSKTIQAGNATKALGACTAVGGTAKGIAESGALEKLSEISEKASAFQVSGEALSNAASWGVQNLWLIAAIGAALGLYLIGRHINLARLRDHATGANMGR